MNRLFVLLTVCAALGAGCFKVTYQNPLLPPNGVVHEGTSKFFILALVGDSHVPAYQMCPGGVSRIETRLSFVDLLLTGITFGIYTPRSYVLECGGMAAPMGPMAPTAMAPAATAGGAQ